MTGTATTAGSPTSYITGRIRALARKGFPPPELTLPLLAAVGQFRHPMT